MSNDPKNSPAVMWWDGGERAITAREKALIEEHSPSSFAIPLIPARTHGARWAADGQPDPHGRQYEGERSALTLGHYTDDELANAVFLHGNEQPSMAALASGKALPGIAYLTAAKDRIRWLSRALASSLSTSQRSGTERLVPHAAALELIGDAYNAGCHGIGYSQQAMDLLDAVVSPSTQVIERTAGMRAIADERLRQVEAEAFSAETAADYKAGELAKAALAYVQLAAMDLSQGGREHIAAGTPPACWPWPRLWWKPKDARRDLVRAGALIAAQIDVIDRDGAAGVGS